MTGPVVRAGALHHVAIAGPSLADAARFYREVLGYDIGAEHVMAEQRVRVVFATRGESRVELLEPLDRDSGVARFVAERGRPTLHHVCFEVDDLDATLGRLAAEGVELIDRVPRQGVEGRVAFLHPRASDGVLVELIEPRR